MKALMEAQVGHRLKVYTMHGSFIGIVEKIIPAGVMTTYDEVLQYYGKDDTYKYHTVLMRPVNVDKIVIKKESGTYFVVGRTPKADRYLLDVERLS